MNRAEAAQEILRRRRVLRECETLAGFARHAWRVIEPSAELRWGWALDAECEHLEAVTRGEILRLLSNVPPGMMKSLLTGVIWPAWEWGPKGLAHHRFMGTSHKQDLATRDNLKCRRLITSDWFQSRWPTPLSGDQNSKTKFENKSTGFREAMAFTSMTGSRGDRVILDDPLSVDDANSQVELKNAELTFLEALPTRVNNDRSAVVVIMQRLHEQDTSGIILDMGLSYTHLMLPMMHEHERRCYSVVRPTHMGESPQTVRGRYDGRRQMWYLEGEEIPREREAEVMARPLQEVYLQDPRTEDGELLFPERFPQAQVDDLEQSLGAYGTAGQLQQRPSPRGGGLFKKEWFKFLPVLPAGCRMVRGWDLAATPDAKAAATAGCLMGKDPEGRYIIADMTVARLSSGGVNKLLKETAVLDDYDHGTVRGSLPKDPGQAGKSQAEYLVTDVLAGHNYHATPESGDKETRALPLAAQAEAGNLYLVRGEWNSAFITEATGFPMGKFKDQIDAASRAFSELVEPQPTAWIATRRNA